MRKTSWPAIGLLVGLALLPAGAAAQEKAGVATVIEGDVTTRRVSLPQPVPLRFKDDVFRHDTIATAERSLARLLLGGKAVVTVRERSLLTVTEVPGASRVELGNGKVGLAVLRQRMQPGDVVEIRTPNAVVAVRGTVVIAEIVPLAGLTSGGLQSNVYVLTGTVEVQALQGGVPVGAVHVVGRRQMISISPLAAPRVTPIAESQVAQITAGLQPSGRAPAAQTAAKEAALRAAANELVLAPAGGEDGLLADDRFVRAPIVPTLPTPPGSAAAAPPAPVVLDVPVAAPAPPTTRPAGGATPGPASGFTGLRSLKGPAGGPSTPPR